MILTTMSSDNDLRVKLNRLQDHHKQEYDQLVEALESFIQSSVCLLTDDEIHALVQRDIDFFVAIDGCNK